MSLHRITPDNLEYFTIETHPSRSYSKRLRRGANGEVLYFTGSGGSLEEYTDSTGSVNIFSMDSRAQKELYALSSYINNTFKDENLEIMRKQIVKVTSSNVSSLLTSYLSGVHATTSSLRTQAKVEILRFTPPFNFNSNTIRKTLATDHLMPFYRTRLDNCNFSFTNYNSLNLYSNGPDSSDFPMSSDSVLLYPNPQISSSYTVISGASHYDSQYGIGYDEPFSFDFWIKIKGKTTGSYTPGTIMHLSGVYAISIHSGSSKDPNGYINKFRLGFQLAHSASVNPKNLNPNVNDQNVNIAYWGSYFTTDNSLDYNKWHHITIRHPGTANYNQGTGSIEIDSVTNCYMGYGGIGSIGQHVATASLSPDALAVGAFYNGPNLLANFFNTNSSLRDGLEVLSNETSDPDTSDYSFDCQFEGEIHDLKKYDKYLLMDEIKYLQNNGPKTLNNIKFYLPPFFTEESPYRQFVGEWGGILLTPFQEKDGTSIMPFAPELSFGVGGHYPNLENYVRDFGANRYPRLINLTGSSITPPNNIVQTANYFLYDSGSNVGANKKRLYSILPCDHGNWAPNFSFLTNLSGAQPGHRYSNDLGNLDIASVSLRDILPDSYISASKAIKTSGSILNDVLGPRPESMDEDQASSLTILHRTKDNSSNQVCFFDISNLFYGNRIKPGTLVLSDPKLTGSDGKLSMRLMDNGRGNIYRADSIGNYSTWNSCGNIFYDEGIIILKHPSLFFFGKEGFDISFKGEHNIHVLTINATAYPMELLSSSNPSFSKYNFQNEPGLANDPDKNFVYITSVNIHDENLNVIMRTHMAQPVVKRSSDRLVFKVKIDY